jgi:quinol monooxygenase YgiN
MILLFIHMKVPSEKRHELTQAIASLIEWIRPKRGCLRCNLCCSLEDPNELCLSEEWSSEKTLSDHLRSEHFKVLLGAMSLLPDSHRIDFFIRTARFPGPVDEHSCGIERRGIE